jgi:hypothetical protein
MRGLAPTPAIHSPYCVLGTYSDHTAAKSANRTIFITKFGKKRAVKNGALYSAPLLSHLCYQSSTLHHGDAPRKSLARKIEGQTEGQAREWETEIFRLAGGLIEQYQQTAHRWAVNE